LLTVDQVRLLGSDNIVAQNVRGFADLGIEPTAMEAILETYLYAFRPYGQYTALAETQKNVGA
ncbi:MAG: complex I NDUFA9 subunit family protein, partial [Paracoccaceae bacterium]